MQVFRALAVSNWSKNVVGILLCSDEKKSSDPESSAPLTPFIEQVLIRSSSLGSSSRDTGRSSSPGRKSLSSQPVTLPQGRLLRYQGVFEEGDIVDPACKLARKAMHKKTMQTKKVMHGIAKNCKQKNTKTAGMNPQKKGQHQHINIYIYILFPQILSLKLTDSWL